jgi:hypothetical protein
MEKKIHLTKEGLNKIINIKASFYKGLTEALKTEFKTIEAVTLPEYKPNFLNLNYD